MTETPAKNPVELAVRLVGGPTQASFICRMSAAAVSKWCRLGIVADARAAVLLSQATNGVVSVAQLAGLHVINGGAPTPVLPPDGGDARVRRSRRTASAADGPRVVAHLAA